jgi:hypothetical protein
MILSTHGIVGSQIATASLLLDLYPSAAAAYSVRKLRTLYTGNAIRVRRSSDNTESNIGFTALGNLDESALTTFCSGTNGFVTTWYDQSGNGLNVTQSSATKQPQIVNAGAVILQNSKPALKFDATNDVLGIPSADATTLALSNITQFIVHKVGASITGYYQMALRRDVVGGNTLNYDVLIDLPTKFFAFYNGSADYRSSVTGNINTQYLTNLIGDVTNDTKVYNNNTLIISQAVKMGNLSVPNGAFNIGNFDSPGSYSEKYMQEVIVYGSKKTADLSNINTSINTYYGIY